MYFQSFLSKLKINKWEWEDDRTSRTIFYWDLNSWVSVNFTKFLWPIPCYLTKIVWRAITLLSKYISRIFFLEKIRTATFWCLKWKLRRSSAPKNLRKGFWFPWFRNWRAKNRSSAIHSCIYSELFFFLIHNCIFTYNIERHHTPNYSFTFNIKILYWPECYSS